MINLDRFAYGLPDQQNSNESATARHCKQCDAEVYQDKEHVLFHDDVFCDVYCFARYMGAEEVN